MPTAPTIMEPTCTDIEKEILAHPEVQVAMAQLCDPEDREDLLDALMVRRRIEDGKEQRYTLEEVMEKLGL